MTNFKANTVKTIFGRETSVGISINAPASKVWKLLTDSSQYPNWNTTVLSIEGNITMGESIKLKSKLDPKRVFKLKG